MPKDEPESQILKTIHQQKSVIVALLAVLFGILFVVISPALEAQSTLSRLLNQFGATLLSAGLISLVYAYALRQAFLQEMRGQLRDALRNEFPQLFAIKDAGIQKLYDEFPTDQVVKGLSNAQAHIKIFTTWIPHLYGIEHTFFYAVKRGCTVQILILNPQSDFAKYRSRDLRFLDLDGVKKEIEANLAELGRYCELNKIVGDVEIRLYEDTIPTFFFIAYDDTFIFSPYFKYKMGIHTCQIEVKGANSPLVMALNEHFDAVWPTATPYPYKNTG